MWTHRQQLQQGNVPDPTADRHDAAVPQLAHPLSRLALFSSARLPLLHASLATSALVEPQLLPAAACMCVFAFGSVCESE